MPANTGPSDLTPITYTDLLDHLFTRFQPLIRSTAAKYHMLSVDDVEQEGRWLIYKLWLKAPLFGVSADGEELRELNVAGAQGYFRKALGPRCLNLMEREHTHVRVPHRKLKDYKAIKQEADERGVHPRDLAESAGMSLDLFDHITTAVAGLLSVDASMHSPHNLYDYADSLVAYDKREWEDLIDDATAEAVRDARAPLSRAEDEVVETFYYDLTQADASDEAVAELLTRRRESTGEKVTPGYTRRLHSEAMLKMRKVLAPHLLPPVEEAV